MTRADVEIYDRIFGEFNPLRAETRADSKASVRLVSSTESDSSPSDREPGDAGLAISDLRADANSDTSLGLRIAVAARHRRAEISKIRDEALVKADTQLMLKAQKMEDFLNAFAEAQAEVRNQASTQVDSAAGTAARVRADLESRIDAKGSAEIGTNAVKSATEAAASGSARGDASFNGAAAANTKP